MARGQPGHARVRAPHHTPSILRQVQGTCCWWYHSQCSPFPSSPHIVAGETIHILQRRGALPAGQHNLIAGYDDGCSTGGGEEVVSDGNPLTGARPCRSPALHGPAGRPVALTAKDVFGALQGAVGAVCGRGGGPGSPW